MTRLAQAIFGFSSALAMLLLMNRPALACGVSAGSGGVAVCSLEEIREKERKKWHVGASYGFTSTKLVFSGDPLADSETVEQTRHIAVAVAEWRTTPNLSFQVGAGALLAGQLGSASLLGAMDSTLSMTPGVVAMLGSSYVILRSQGAVPFVMLSGQLSAVFAGTEANSFHSSGKYRAFDLRVGASVGWTFWKMLSPYALVRAFGGPADWELNGDTIRGTDRYHYQVGAGLSLLLDYRFDLFVEGVPLGERGVVAGAGFAF